MADFLVCTGSNVLLPEATGPVPATIIVDRSSGKIIDVRPIRLSRQQLILESVEWIDAGDNIVLPGLVDPHVHLNEPGRTAWEGFWTGTKAAIAGGITTLVDMPLNSIPPTTSVQNLDVKRQAAQGQCHSDIAFWGGVIPGNQIHLKPLLKAGVCGFKCFLIHSGVEEFPCVTESDLVGAMKELNAASGVLLFHAELGDTVEEEDVPNPRQYTTFLASRPQKLETKAISLVIELQKRYPNVRCHIVHLSASSALPLIKEAKALGLPLTVETCFHYLCLAAEDIPDGHPEFKCCPPVRENSNRDKLWEALRDGTIDCVVSDHSPCVGELKNLGGGNIMTAWGGISALGLGLSLLWTEGQKRGVTLKEVVDWMSAKTAKHAGLQNRKGQLTIGYDGDFLIWDRDTEFEVTGDLLQYKNKISPYMGMKLYGRVVQTYVRGNKVYDHVGGFWAPSGRLLELETARS